MHNLEAETKANMEKAVQFNAQAKASMDQKKQIQAQTEQHVVEEEHMPNLAYTRQHGFNPNNFEIINDAMNVQTGARLESDPICSSAGCTQYKHKHKALGYDIDYFVPHFGADTEINESKESLVTAEKMLGHTFDFPNAKWKKPKAVKWVKVAPYDEDVVDTQKNLADAEKQLGHTWNM